jgi:hypothetical protein
MSTPVEKLHRFDPLGKTRTERQMVVRPAAEEVLSGHGHSSITVDDVDGFRDWLVEAGLPDWVDRRDALLTLNWLCYREGARFYKSHEIAFLGNIEYAKLIVVRR